MDGEITENNAQLGNSILPPEKNYDPGSVDIWSDPRFVTDMDARIDEFATQTLNAYGNIPGVEEELRRQVNINKASIRKTQAEALTEYVTDIYRNKLAEIGRFAKMGEFAKTYTDMALTISDPKVLSALGPNGARDLLQESFGNYLEEKANVYNTVPHKDKLKAIDDMLTDPGVLSIIPTTTLKFIQNKRGEMAESLGSRYKLSEAEKRGKVLNTMKKELQKIHGADWKKHWPMSEKNEYEYRIFGEKANNPFSEELSDREYRTEQAKKMKESGLFTDREVMEYEATKKIPTPPAKAKYFENIELIKMINDERKKETSITGETIPLLTREEEESILLTSTLPEDSEAKAREKLLQLMMNAGLVIDKKQKALFMATGKYEASELQTAKAKVEAIESILGRPLTEPEKQRLFKLSNEPLVEVNLSEKEGVKSAVRIIEADIKALSVAGAEARTLRTNLAFFEDVLDSAKKDGQISPTGAFAAPILGITKAAEFLQQVFPKNELFPNIIKKLGKAATKEALDASSKRMVLFIAKYVGRITNLSLRFSRDSVPGILKTESGNRLIIALMKKQGSIDEGLARIGDAHTQAAAAGSGYGSYIDGSGLKHKDYNTEKYAFIDANRPEDDPELEKLFKQTQIEINSLPENKGKKPPPLKKLKDVIIKVPERTNKDFQKYLKSKGLIWDEGTKFHKVWRDPKDGMSYFVFRDAEANGFRVSTHWDDKDPITNPIPIESQ